MRWVWFSFKFTLLNWFFASFEMTESVHSSSDRKCRSAKCLKEKKKQIRQNENEWTNFVDSERYSQLWQLPIICFFNRRPNETIGKKLLRIKMSASFNFHSSSINYWSFWLFFAVFFFVRISACANWKRTENYGCRLPTTVETTKSKMWLWTPVDRFVDYYWNKRDVCFSTFHKRLKDRENRDIFGFVFRSFSRVFYFSIFFFGQHK